MALILKRRQRWEKPKAPSRINRHSKFGPYVIFAALFNEQSGNAYDISEPHATVTSMPNAFNWWRSSSGVPVLRSGGAFGPLRWGSPTKTQFTQAQSFTIVTLFVHNTASQNFANILAQYNGIGAPAIWMIRTNSTTDVPQFLVGALTGGFATATASTSFAIGSRYMVVGVQDVGNAAVSIYVNGKLETAVGAPTGTWTTTADVLGNDDSSLNSFSFGADYIMYLILNRALSAGEVAELYNDPYSWVDDAWGWPTPQMEGIWLPSASTPVNSGPKLMPYDSIVTVRLASKEPYESLFDPGWKATMPYASAGSAASIGLSRMPYEFRALSALRLPMPYDSILGVNSMGKGHFPYAFTGASRGGKRLRRQAEVNQRPSFGLPARQQQPNPSRYLSLVGLFGDKKIEAAAEVVYTRDVVQNLSPPIICRASSSTLNGSDSIQATVRSVFPMSRAMRWSASATVASRMEWGPGDYHKPGTGDFTVAVLLSTTEGPLSGTTPGAVSTRKFEASAGAPGWSVSLHDALSDARWYGTVSDGATDGKVYGINDISDGKPHLLIFGRRGTRILFTNEDGKPGSTGTYSGDISGNLIGTTGTGVMRHGAGQDAATNFRLRDTDIAAVWVWKGYGLSDAECRTFWANIWGSALRVDEDQQLYWLRPTVPVGISQPDPYESLTDPGWKAPIPYASSGFLQGKGPMPYESVINLKPNFKIPYESRVGVARTHVPMPYESSGVPTNNLHLFWNVINTSLVNVPLTLIWSIVPGPGVINPLTLQWNIKDIPAPLTLRWRVMSNASALFDEDIQKPVAEIEEA